MGTYGAYKRRYPKEYKYFTGVNEKTTYKHSKSKKLVNEYDNAVRYNDMIVTKIIEKVKQKNQNSYVLYFSDHGDELFDEIDLVGHNEYYGTNSMYEIPFIVWTSK